VSPDADGPRGPIREGLAALGIERLTLVVHDSSFPSTASEDIGRGSPYGRGARSLLELASGLGFNSLQLGPQGETSLVNPSPYDGAHLSKSVLSIALGSLSEGDGWAELCSGLGAPESAARALDGDSRDVTRYEDAWRASRALLAALYARFQGLTGAAPSPVAARFGSFGARWAQALRSDGIYEALSVEHGTDDWRSWPAAHRSSDASAREAFAAERAGELARHLFGQFVLDEQHRALRAFTRSLGISLFGDLQIGYSQRDIWRARDLFRTDYLMGAPPSRTNPLGQAWGYPVLDTDGARSEALALVGRRLDRLLADFDGIRIDHPHGWVCPWVYRADDPDPAAAVARGARLRCSPNLAGHPGLATLAIPRPEQLSVDPGISPYADDWVKSLSDDQVDRYGLVFDALMARLRADGRRDGDVVCEVLSTWPYPLRRVMERYGLGRFCVTQKADLSRANDVYRSENASPRDWIMVGNHDTPPLWSLVEAWHGTAVGRERASALAERLCARPALRPRLARWIAADGRHLAQAMFAELFVGPARRVSMFFADWLGYRATYNRPGVVHPDNWRLRIRSSFAEDYRRDVARGAAFNSPLALAMALAARGAAADSSTGLLVRRLLDDARRLTPGAEGEELYALVIAGQE
jgi:4-alpha-glucanotransferase